MLQVSVSVIGEGLIQLRGPIKGINEIRTMINQIDAPTSQVRVGIHTVQINGEHGDRIEKVATRIQDYVDHARFLTAQSSQMLRNAVVKVAGEKAHEAALACPNFAAHIPGVPCPDDTQKARDARYQEAFFGCDFINELRAIDSEFLMTGNKLLSLHSMDTTSLASALFLIALAKNDVRMQILDEFQQSMQIALPAAENDYYSAGAVGRVKDHHNEFKLFALNARFRSFLGFFDAQVAGPIRSTRSSASSSSSPRSSSRGSSPNSNTNNASPNAACWKTASTRSSTARRRGRHETKTQKNLVDALKLIQNQRASAAKPSPRSRQKLGDGHRKTIEAVK